MNNLCECGCRETPKIGNRFINHHNSRVFSEETRRKISEANKGKIPSEETLKNLDKGRRGRTVTAETRNKLSISNRGQKRSIETRQKMSEAKKGKAPWNKGLKGCYIRSEESKRKASIALKIRGADPEYRKQLSERTTREWRSGRKKLSPHSVNNRYGTPTLYKDILMRSKFESKIALMLDNFGIKWEYELKAFYLKELNCVYHPDFYLPEFDIWLEGKFTEDINKYPELKKAYALRDQGFNVTVVTNKDLKDLEYSLLENSLAKSSGVWLTDEELKKLKKQ